MYHEVNSKKAFLMSTDNFLEFKTEGSPTETTEKTDKRSIFLVSLLVEFLLFCCRLK